MIIQQLLQREVIDKIDVSEEEIRSYLIAKSKATQQNNEYHLARWTTRIPDTQKKHHQAVSNHCQQQQKRFVPGRHLIF